MILACVVHFLQEVVLNKSVEFSEQNNTGAGVCLCKCTFYWFEMILRVRVDVVWICLNMTCDIFTDQIRPGPLWTSETYLTRGWEWSACGCHAVSPAQAYKTTMKHNDSRLNYIQEGHWWLAWYLRNLYVQETTVGESTGALGL